MNSQGLVQSQESLPILHNFRTIFIKSFKHYIVFPDTYILASWALIFELKTPTLWFTATLRAQTKPCFWLIYTVVSASAFPFCLQYLHEQKQLSLLGSGNDSSCFSFLKGYFPNMQFFHTQFDAQLTHAATFLLRLISHCQSCPLTQIYCSLTLFCERSFTFAFV